jgi:hypothetical protein
MIDIDVRTQSHIQEASRKSRASGRFFAGAHFHLLFFKLSAFDCGSESDGKRGFHLSAPIQEVRKLGFQRGPRLATELKLLAKGMKTIHAFKAHRIGALFRSLNSVHRNRSEFFLIGIFA